MWKEESKTWVLVTKRFTFLLHVKRRIMERFCEYAEDVDLILCTKVAMSLLASEVKLLLTIVLKQSNGVVKRDETALYHYPLAASN